MANAPAAQPASRSLGLTLRARTKIGAEVVRVERGSAADRAGLAVGDVITLVADVSGADAGAGHAVVRLHRPGSARDGGRHAGRRPLCDDLGTMTPHPTGDPLGLLDPSLDVPGDEALGPLPGTDGRRSRRWRGLLVWSATSAPVALLLTAGIAFGPQGINLLSPATLSLLDPVVPVALAALGVLVGLGVGDRRTDDRRVLGAACLAAAVTMLVVSAGFAVVALAAMSSIAQPFWTLILTGGICAATSLTLPTGNPLEPRPAATRVIELGVLLPIVAGGLMLAWLRAGSSVGRWRPGGASVRRHPCSGRRRHGCC